LCFTVVVLILYVFSADLNVPDEKAEDDVVDSPASPNFWTKNLSKMSERGDNDDNDDDDDNDDNDDNPFLNLRLSSRRSTGSAAAIAAAVAANKEQATVPDTIAKDNTDDDDDNNDGDDDATNGDLEFLISAGYPRTDARAALLASKGSVGE